MIAPCLDWFEDYFAGFAMDDPADGQRLELKRQHCLLVMDESRQQARELGLSAHLTDLATVVGLVHDVGRFPQYRRYRTFRDADSANHAVLGNQVLARHGGLVRFSARDRGLVRLAVMTHNRRTLPRRLLSGGDPEALVLARIVRDADKLDIVRVMLEHFAVPGEKDPVVFLGLPERPGRFNPAIIADIEAGRIGNYYDMESVNDFALLLLSWINDMAFARTRRLFFRRGYVDALFGQLPQTPELTAFAARYRDRHGPRTA